MKADFLKHQAQTSPHPLALEISSAKGSYITDTTGKQYLDFIAGVSANSLGHNHPKVSTAIKKQVDAYTHVHGDEPYLYGLKNNMTASPIFLCISLKIYAWSL